MPTDRVLVNFRLPKDLVDLIDRAAGQSGLNRTEWVSSTLAVAVREGLKGAALAVAAGVSGVRIDGCAHPRHRRVWGAQGLVCGDCGTVLERTRQGA